MDQCGAVAGTPDGRVPPTVDALCIGHAAWDLVFAVDGPICVDKKYRAASLLQSGGGPAANAACLLARWGSRTVFAGRAGNDAFGQLMVREFAEAGVDTSLFVLESSVPTPLTCVLVDRQVGTRTLVNHRAPLNDARARLPLASVSPRLVLCDGHEPALAHEALGRFPGAISILDGGSYRPETHDLALRVEHLVVSRDFAAKATGLDPTDDETASLCLSTLARRYPGRVAITRGVDGVTFFDDRAVAVHLRPPPVTAVDTTAAGDIFHGALAWALLNDYDYSGAVGLASRAAALSTTRPGGRSSIPDACDAMSQSAADHTTNRQPSA